MSFNFYLGGDQFDQESWYQSVATYLRINSEALLPATWQFGLDCSVPEDVSSDKLSGEHNWVLPKGGIRGVGFRPSEDGIEFVVATQASKKDLELVDQFVALGLECGGKAWDEEDEPITRGENQPSQQFEKWWKFGRSTAATLLDRDESETITMPVRGFGVAVSRSDLELNDEDLMSMLAGKVERYASAFFPSILGVEKDGKTARVVVYSDRGTLIPEEIDGIAIVEADKHGIPDLVPLAPFIEAMGDLAEKSGDFWYVDECGFLSAPANYERFAGLPALMADAIVDREPEEEEATAPGESDEDSMEYLIKMPIYVFFFVAGADGEVDKKETEVFFTLLQNASESPSAIFADSVARLLPKFGEIFPEVVSEELPRLPIQIALAKAVIETTITDPEENSLYKRCLLTLAKAIAESSGGFLGFGSKISRSERKAIESLKDLLEVPGFKI